jgi:capsular polysaccharide biosynthesis protein
MELRAYWDIIRKRWGLVAALLVIVAVSGALTAQPPAPSFTATMRFVVGIRPEEVGRDVYTYDRYYTWLTAEYLCDDLAEVIKSRAFAADVARRAGLAVPPGAIQGATSAGKLHRIVTVSIVWPNEAELKNLAEAVALTLREEGNVYFAQLDTAAAVASLIDPPSITRAGVSLRQRLDLPLRLLLALVAGVALTILLDYLDVTIRHRADLAALGLPILAEIPPRRDWRAWVGWRRPQP